MSTNNREFDFFALMASLEAHMYFQPCADYQNRQY